MIPARAIGAIKSRHSGSLTTRCKENDCSLNFAGADHSEFAVISGGKYQKAENLKEKLADCIVIGRAGRGFVCSIELKSGRLGHISEVVEQIQQGLSVAESILRELGVSPDTIEWHPVVLYGRGIKPVDMQKLRKSLVRFGSGNDSQRHIRWHKCDTPLSAILGNE